MMSDVKWAERLAELIVINGFAVISSKDDDPIFRLDRILYYIQELLPKYQVKVTYFSRFYEGKAIVQAVYYKDFMQ